MSMYWIVAVFYTILNVVKGIKKLKESKEEYRYNEFIVIILVSLFLTPVAILIDIYDEIKKL